MNIQGYTLQKKTDSIYRIEPTGKMNVPVKLFTNETLLENIGDNSLNQACNVATLPGIKTASVVMPDMHQGYGFSIGGVAAFDMKKGIISPGGIGFDINCLTRDSKILSGDGYWKPVQDFEADFQDVEAATAPYSLKMAQGNLSLFSFDTVSRSFSSKTAGFFMKRKHRGQVFRIETKLGFSLSVTGEHPILTKTGMKPAEQLLRDQEIAVFPFEGVQHQPVGNQLLVDESLFTKQEQDELQKRGLLPLTLDHPKMPIITKLFGYLLGDGSIYLSGKKGYVNAYGPETDLKEIQEDLRTLGFSARIYGRERDHRIPTRYGPVEFKTKNFELHTPSKALAKLFFALGYPEGNKTATQFVVPKWIMQNPLWLKRLFLAGLFGAELSSPRTHTKTGFDCPTLSMNKNTKAIESGRYFAIQIMKLLEEFGVETHKLLHREDYYNNHGTTERLRIQISSEEENLLRLWGLVGFAYNKKRERLSHIALLYIREKKRLTRLRNEIARKTKAYKQKGLTLKEVQQLLVCDIANPRFIERHYYGEAGQRIPLSFDSFKEYVTKNKECIETHGCLFDTIESISCEQYDDEVYDFNIPETHSFVADNIVVSNCGVRVLATPLTAEEVRPKIKELLEKLFANCPVGVGSEARIRLSDEDYEDLMKRGVAWAVDNGYGTADDLAHCESNGCIPGADFSKTSRRAQKRGRRQLGTVGAGNHFIEVQYVEEIYDEEVAKAYRLTGKGQVVVMIHCGSRGFGHQVCTDYIRRMEEEQPQLVGQLVDKNLIYAPLGSEVANDYFAAMNAAANYAFTNRHVLSHFVRKSFAEVFGKDVVEKMLTVYDICHNIAKKETHLIDGREEEVMLHRKGATRAFPPGFEELPEEYRQYGQPVLIPGSMGTHSYILHGTEIAMKESFGSCAHGAGRLMSRFKATKEFSPEAVTRQLHDRRIEIKAASKKGIVEESPGAYKDVDQVIEVCDASGIAKKVAKLTPIGVVKG